MFDALGKILGFVEAAFEFFLNMIESLFQAIGFLVSSIPFITTIVPYMPPILGSCIVITLAIAVVKFLIGR